MWWTAKEYPRSPELPNHPEAPLNGAESPRRAPAGHPVRNGQGVSFSEEVELSPFGFEV